MNDRGEKIINLAREMLRTEFPLERHACPDIKKAQVSLKTLYLTVFLAAFGSGTLIHAIDEVRRPINRQEKVELDALVFYTAKVTSLDENTVRHDVMNRLTLENLNNLSVYDYRRARNYLWTKLR